MVNMPISHVFPIHTISKFAFDISFEKFIGTTYESACIFLFLLPFQCTVNSSSLSFDQSKNWISQKLLPHVSQVIFKNFSLVLFLPRLDFLFRPLDTIQS